VLSNIRRLRISVLHADTFSRSIFCRRPLNNRKFSSFPRLNKTALEQLSKSHRQYGGSRGRHVVRLQGCLHEIINKSICAEIVPGTTEHPYKELFLRHAALWCFASTFIIHCEGTKSSRPCKYWLAGDTDDYYLMCIGPCIVVITEE